MAIQGILDLLDSERGVVFILLLTMTTIFLAIGIITADQWLEFTKWVTVTLIASKAVTTAVDTYVNRKPAPEQPTVAKPPAAPAAPPS